MRPRQPSILTHADVTHEDVRYVHPRRHPRGRPRQGRPCRALHPRERPLRQDQARQEDRRQGQGQGVFFSRVFLHLALVSSRGPRAPRRETQGASTTARVRPGDRANGSSPRGASIALVTPTNARGPRRTNLASERDCCRHPRLRNLGLFRAALIEDKISNPRADR